MSYAAAPYDEIAQLDMVQAEKSAGDQYIAKPPLSADLSEVLERLAENDDADSDS